MLSLLVLPPCAMPPLDGERHEQLRFILTAAPPGPPATSKITQIAVPHNSSSVGESTSAMKDRANREDGSSCTLALLTLPNSVLWEAVAALAESVLMDGACWCWLRGATQQHLDDARRVGAFGRKEKDSGSDNREASATVASARRKGGRARNRSKTASGPTTNSASGRRTATHGEWTESGGAGAHLLAQMLLYFDAYAAQDLMRFAVSDGMDGPPMVHSLGEVQEELVLGDDSVPTQAVSLFPALAAALVRSVALHAARLLHPLAATDEERLTGADEDDGAVRQRCGDGFHYGEAASTHIPQISSSTVQLDDTHTTSVVQFRVLQEELKQRRRQLQRTRQLPADASTFTAKRRRSTKQKKACETSSMTDEAADLPGGTSPLSRQLLQLKARVRAAEERDESVFLVVAAAAAARERTNSCAPHTATTEQRGSAMSSEQDWVPSFVRCFVEMLSTDASGPRVLCRSVAGCTVFSISCVLPEGFENDKPLSSVPTPREFPAAAQTEASSSISAKKSGSRPVPGSAAKSNRRDAYGTVTRWCMGLQQLAATTLSAADHDTPNYKSHLGASLSRFTMSAAHLYRYLHDHAVNPQAELVTHYAVHQDRTVLSSSHSPVKSSGGSAKSDDVAGCLPGTEERSTPHPSRAPPWTGVRWSIRPYVGPGSIAEELQLNVQAENACISTCEASAQADTPADETPCCEDKQEGRSSSGLKRPRQESDAVSPTRLRTLPDVRWVQLVSTTTGSALAQSSVPIAGEVQSSTAALFDDLLPSRDATLSSSSDDDVSGVAEALDEVGAVLACVEAVCAGRTLLDASSWRYGRNRIHIAAASFIDINTTEHHVKSPDTLPHIRSAEGEPALFTKTTPPTPDTPSCEVRPVGSAAEKRSATVGLYHHESGLLYVSGGKTYAMETT